MPHGRFLLNLNVNATRHIPALAAMPMRTPIILFLLVASIGCSKQVDKAQLTVDSECFDSERYGLETISSKADLNHIRIWYSHSFLDRVPVVSLRQSKTGEWSGELFLIIWNFDKHPP